MSFAAFGAFIFLSLFLWLGRLPGNVGTSRPFFPFNYMPMVHSNRVLIVAGINHPQFNLCLTDLFNLFYFNIFIQVSYHHKKSPY